LPPSAGLRQAQPDGHGCGVTGGTVVVSGVIVPVVFTWTGGTVVAAFGFA
jgi:hypothetical protein